MLAFRLPIPVGYDLDITLLSLLLPILVSGMALRQISRPDLRWQRLAAGSILIGLGINTMHYTGMAAMRMDPAISYDPLLFALSVVIAIGASALALWIGFRLGQDLPYARLLRAGAAVVMGIAIAGMHYTGMAAARFAAGSICTAATRGVSHDSLALLVVIATLGILAVALLASIFDARLETHSRSLAASQATAAERQVMLLRERAARSEAESLSAIKDEFLATLSHELRTPLNAILGWAELLLPGTQDPATLRRGLETIERNARAQARLIDDLLDMSRIISGKVRLEVQPVDPGTIIDAALETVRPAAIAKNIALDKELDKGAGPITGDPARLQQVMWNLLSNGVKFTPAGGSVRVALARGQGEAVVTVADTGIGIKPGFLPYVFDRFRQEDASTTRHHGGLGLGLSIARQLVELQGGTIEVASEGEGRGACFTLRFPVQAAPAPAAAGSGAAREAPVPAPPGFAPVDLSGIKVLAVDDAVDALELVKQILKDSGATTLTATSARCALSLLESQKPDVIVSDIGMPGVDGFEFIRRVRELGHARGGSVPAVALTAFTRSEDRGNALEAGFDAYVAKPVEPMQLLSALASVVEQRDG
jgi:signal transduction histidine kinase/ActR/RegA family two-component response regulator